MEAAYANYFHVDRRSSNVRKRHHNFRLSDNLRSCPGAQGARTDSLGEEMRPQRLDTTLALKAINLSPLLSGADKRVICAILDHYNHKTGQCDPSLNTVAELLGVHRRTVIRSVKRVVGLGLLRKVRHGGYSQRNAYSFDWARYRALEAKWMEQRKIRKQIRAANLSPSWCHDSHVAGDALAPQTNPINSNHKTSHARVIISDEQRAVNGIAVTHVRSQRVGSPFHVKRVNSLDAMHAAAERRWHAGLLNLYRDHPQEYALIIDAIDEPLAASATELEAKHPGAATHFIVERLVERGLHLIKRGVQTSERP